MTGAAMRVMGPALSGESRSAGVATRSESIVSVETGWKSDVKRPDFSFELSKGFEPKPFETFDECADNECVQRSISF